MVNNPLLKNHVLFVIGLNIFAVLLIILSFTFIDNPFDKQAKQYDQQRIESIQRLKSKVDEYYRTHRELPETLHNVSFSSYENKDIIISDPKTHDEYEYRISTPATYQLCATFAKSSKNNTQDSGISDVPRPVPLMAPSEPYIPESYDHPAGYHCLEFRTPYVTPTPSPYYYRPIYRTPTYYPLPTRVPISPRVITPQKPINNI